MIRLIEALRMSVVALRDTSGGEEMLARRKAAIKAAERVLEEELDSFLFGEGSIEVTLRTVKNSRMYANRQYIRLSNFSNTPQSDLVAHGSAILWEEMERVIEKDAK